MSSRRLAPAKASRSEAASSKSALRTVTPRAAQAARLSGLRLVAMICSAGTFRVWIRCCSTRWPNWPEAPVTSRGYDEVRGMRELRKKMTNHLKVVKIGLLVPNR
ncbi:hypothetical protein D9M69_651040 [compost metagenome]